MFLWVCILFVIFFSYLPIEKNQKLFIMPSKKQKQTNIIYDTESSEEEIEPKKVKNHKRIETSNQKDADLTNQWQQMFNTNTVSFSAPPFFQPTTLTNTSSPIFQEFTNLKKPETTIQIVEIKENNGSELALNTNQNNVDDYLTKIATTTLLLAVNTTTSNSSQEPNTDISSSNSSSNSISNNTLDNTLDNNTSAYPLDNTSANSLDNTSSNVLNNPLDNTLDNTLNNTLDNTLNTKEQDSLCHTELSPNILSNVQNEKILTRNELIHAASYFQSTNLTCYASSVPLPSMEANEFYFHLKVLTNVVPLNYNYTKVKRVSNWYHYMFGFYSVSLSMLSFGLLWSFKYMEH